MNVNLNKTKVMVFERDEDMSLCDVKINDVSVCLSRVLPVI